MTYRAIYSDIDGTLLNRAHRMSPRTLAITRRLAQAGIPIILVSARPPLAITPFTDAIGGKQPLIAFNGALIADLHRLEALLENDPAITSINYYQGTHWYSPDPDNFWTVQEGDITSLRATKRPASLTNVHKILVMGDAPVIRALQERLKPQFPHLEIHRSKDEYLEIVNKRATKAQAIAFMGERLGVPAAESVAFGDNYNDLDMLRYAGYSVAMGNAPDDIKAECSIVTAPNDEDGLAQVLERLFPA